MARNEVNLLINFVDANLLFFIHATKILMIKCKSGPYIPGLDIHCKVFKGREPESVIIPKNNNYYVYTLIRPNTPVF